MAEDNTSQRVTRRTVVTVAGAATIANLGGTVAATTGTDDSPATESTPDAQQPDKTAVNVALDRCELAVAPDPRVAHFDVTALRTEGGGVSLHGAVQNEFQAQRAIDAAQNATHGGYQLPEQAADQARRATGPAVDTDELVILDEIAESQTIQTAVAPVRDEPTADSGLLTEVLYGAAVTAFDSVSGWMRVLVPDGYIGWVQTDDLTDPASGPFDAVLRTDVDGAIDGHNAAYAGTDCHIVAEAGDGSCVVTFRTGRTAKIPAESVVEPDPVPTVETVIENAEYYLGTETPYLWGGMTSEGIDCSGFVWMAYRIGGLTLPRDSDQQQQVGTRVSRDELQPGDLLCFPGHIAMSLGGDEFIHSASSENGPATNSFDPDADDYYEYLDESFQEARRIL